MIKIKRIYDSSSAKDGRRILIDRLWPRGIKKNEAKIDEWMKDLAPSNELRKWFSHETSKWQEFKKRYVEELRSKSQMLVKFREEAKSNSVTLLYAAKDEAHNNAVVLKEILES